MDIGYLFAISNLGYLLPYRTELTHQTNLFKVPEHPNIQGPGAYQ